MILHLPVKFAPNTSSLEFISALGLIVLSIVNLEGSISCVVRAAWSACIEYHRWEALVAIGLNERVDEFIKVLLSSLDVANLILLMCGVWCVVCGECC